MSKMPSVQHEYHPKRDRLDISIKHYSLEKKSEREDLLKHLLRKLTAGADPARKLKRAKNPWKETRIPEVGD
jgi:hypothetical protein